MSYNQIITASRKKELVLQKQTVGSIIEELSALSDILQNQISNASIDGTLRKGQLLEMKLRVEADLDTFRDVYSGIVDTGINASTRLILERNGELFIEAEGTRKLVDLLQDKVVAEILNIKERDGLILSDRIWRMTEEAKQSITARVQQGILLGESHVKVAKDIRQYLVGTGGMRYKTNRLALSEMSRAYKTANEQSVQMMRENSEFMWFEKWELSPSHSKVDVCDFFASDDPIGEGRGVYKTAPNRHPGCYCYIYPVYREKRKTATYENVSGASPQEVPPNIRREAKKYL